MADYDQVDELEGMLAAKDRWRRASTGALLVAIGVGIYQMVFVEIPLYTAIGNDPTRSTLRGNQFTDAHDSYQTMLIVSLLIICIAAATYFRWTHCVYAIERRFRDARWKPKTVAAGLALPPLSLWWSRSVLDHALSRRLRSGMASDSGLPNLWLLVTGAALVASFAELKLLGTASARSATTGIAGFGIAVSVLQVVALGLSIHIARVVSGVQQRLADTPDATADPEQTLVGHP